MCMRAITIEHVHIHYIMHGWEFRHHTFVLHLNLISGVNVTGFLQMFLKLYKVGLEY